MGNRFSKIYTRTGDDGSTGLSGGSRIDKDAARIEAMGDVDELNSIIGWLCAQLLPASTLRELNTVQHCLLDIGGLLSMPQPHAFAEDHVIELENAMDAMNKELSPLQKFILPGGSDAGARCHIARTVCRRAERRLVALNKQASLSVNTLAYMNRLSDYLFVLARCINHQQGTVEVLWKKGF